MTAAELREKIRSLALQVVGEKSKADDAALAYDELTKFPELKDIIVALLTHEFDSFVEGIDWVSPRPSTFRINLLNGQSFMLAYTPRSWVANVQGKKYYLLNLDEEEFAALAISRILQYGPESGAEVEGSETDSAPEVEDEIDVDVDVEA
jgi:hypothetical protein|tara:strand:+ start:3806 stop:4255 length:450 start_codon:yes stop_codon:yes gene_type:complete